MTEQADARELVTQERIQFLLERLCHSTIDAQAHHARIRVDQHDADQRGIAKGLNFDPLHLVRLAFTSQLLDRGHRHLSNGDGVILTSPGNAANAAMDADPVEYGYSSAERAGSGSDRFWNARDDRDDEQRDWWKQPLGAGLRGGL